MNIPLSNPDITELEQNYVKSVLDTPNLSLGPLLPKFESEFAKYIGTKHAIYRRRSSLLENVIITGIGGVSGSVVAGAIFTLPALYILKLDPQPWQTIFICLAGGCLGVLFLIPLRRNFVREMHGQLPYPEATAITEVLVTGEKVGSQAKLLLQATLLSGVYDFFATTFHVWKEFVDFQFLPVVRQLADKARLVASFDAVAFILGLGYVMGLRSSMILCAGGFLSNFVLVPLDDAPACLFHVHIPTSRPDARTRSGYGAFVPERCLGSFARILRREDSPTIHQHGLKPAQRTRHPVR